MVSIERQGDALLIPTHRKCESKCNTGDIDRINMSCMHFDRACTLVSIDNTLKIAECDKFIFENGKRSLRR